MATTRPTSLCLSGKLDERIPDRPFLIKTIETSQYEPARPIGCIEQRVYAIRPNRANPPFEIAAPASLPCCALSKSAQKSAISRSYEPLSPRSYTLIAQHRAKVLYDAPSRDREIRSTPTTASPFMRICGPDNLYNPRVPLLQSFVPNGDPARRT